jgi:hypothetical protein
MPVKTAGKKAPEQFHLEVVAAFQHSASAFDAESGLPAD